MGQRPGPKRLGGKLRKRASFLEEERERERERLGRPRETLFPKAQSPNSTNGRGRPKPRSFLATPIASASAGAGSARGARNRATTRREATEAKLRASKALGGAESLGKSEDSETVIQGFKPTCRRKTTLHPEAEAGLQPGARKNAAGSAPVIQGPVRGSLGFASLFEELAGPLRPGPGKPKPEAAAGGVSPWRATTARVFPGAAGRRWLCERRRRVSERL